MSDETFTTYQQLIDAAHPIELAEHYALNELLWSTERNYSQGLISAQERAARLQHIHDQKKRSIIAFNTEEEFKQFCEWHGGRLHQEYLHEEEHASVYRAYNIQCIFGFIKIISEGHVGIIPWVTPNWPQNMSARTKMEITLRALEQASEKSPGDLQDIRALQHALARA